MQKQILVPVVLCAGLLVGCDGNGGGTGGTGGTGTLALTAADAPAVTPCPAQTILTDAAELTALKDALQSGTFVHLDVPFSVADPDIFKKKCGLEPLWDPAAAIDEVPPLTTPVTISSLLQFGNAGICAAGFDSGSFGTGEGFPVAGTYRKEFKVAHLGMTWHVRARIKVSGTSAGNTFASEGISVPGDIENTLVYEVDGAVTAHADVLTAAIAALAVSANDAPTFTLDIRQSGAGPIIFTAVVELICVAKM
ncbi:MAG: hypothetical protein ACYTEZ_17010 [Planctomycetota bacterium]|jgi:hypothetical protein